MPDKKTYREINGTTRVGDALRWLAKTGKKVAPELLSVASDVTGIEALEKLGNKISGSKELSDLDKELLLKKIELDKTELEEVSKRWKSDMESDSWASKNIRPYGFGGTLIFTFIIILLDAALRSFTIEEHWVNLLTTLLSIMTVAYFGSRSIEKIKKVAGKYKK